MCHKLIKYYEKWRNNVQTGAHAHINVMILSQIITGMSVAANTNTNYPNHQMNLLHNTLKWVHLHSH